MVDGLEVEPVRHLGQLAAWAHGKGGFGPLPDGDRQLALTGGALDLTDVAGQEGAKRALEIAAAGGHNLLLFGPPGSGKTMLARRLPGLLPPLGLDEALEATAVHSVAGLLRDRGLLAERPFRAPHHSISDAGLVGGSGTPRPGEVSLAHHGVLFLDELPEFRRHVLESLRQPLEDGDVILSRAGHTVTYPAEFQLVAAMNPCPCGFLGDCPARLPLRRRAAAPLPAQGLRAAARPDRPPRRRPRRPLRPAPGRRHRREHGRGGASRPGARGGIQRARRVVECPAPRRRRSGATARSTWPRREVLARAAERLGLSARAHDRILRVARTIADLEGAARVEARHLLEAVQYRALDRLATTEAK